MVSESDINCLDKIKLGDRVESSGDYGTIRYIGPVAGYVATWIGVDWDDPKRGKHDGSLDDVHYFTASYPKSGSFVRPEKLNTGQSAIDSIVTRYGRKEDDVTARINQQKLLAVQREINAPFVEMVGFDKLNSKLSNLHNLKIVSLRLQRVNSPGMEDELAELCPNVEELDLSKNLLNSWSQIIEFCKQLPRLMWLNVSENRLDIPKEISNYTFPSVTHLISGYMKLTWNNVLTISNLFPNLVELRVPYNEIDDIDKVPKESFRCLQILDLEGNAIRIWDKINKFSVISSLEQLVLTNIGITNIKFEDCSSEKQISAFPNLKYLALSENLIDNWESVDELNKLKSLEDLRFLRNPILQQEKLATCRQLIIAKIPALKVLNGTIIQKEERLGAEYDYLKKYGLDYYESIKNGTTDQFFIKHPRYCELMDKCGMPEESELVPHSSTLKSHLIEVLITHKDKTILKKIPATMPTQKLVTLVQRTFNLSDRPALRYVSNNEPDIEVLLDDEYKDVGFYSIQSGDKIIVTE